MAVSKEIIDQILKFYPHDKDSKPVAGRQDVGLGECDTGRELRFGPRVYWTRVSGLDGEPITTCSTKQPALYVVEGPITTTLAYPTDIKAIDGALAQKVADRINVIQARQA